MCIGTGIAPSTVQAAAPVAPNAVIPGDVVVNTTTGNLNIDTTTGVVQTEQ